MKYILTLLFLPLFASAQTEFILHSKTATTTDSTFSNAKGILMITLGNIVVNGTIYPITSLNADTTDRLTSFQYQFYTTPNGTATIERTSTGDPMEVILDDGVEVKAYFTR